MGYTLEQLDSLKQHITEMLKEGKTREEIAIHLGYKSKDSIKYLLKILNIKTSDLRIKRTAKRGDKFGAWTYLEDTQNSRFWKCVCVCGNIKEIDKYSLFCKNRRAQSRGCNQCKNSNMSYKQWTGFEELSGSYWQCVIRGAESRNLEFSISIQYAWDLFIKQEKKCMLTGIPISLNRNKQKQTASLDRIDPYKGYIEGNVQWLHKVVNSCKYTLNNEQFFTMCKLVYINNENKINEDENFTDISYSNSKLGKSRKCKK